MGRGTPKYRKILPSAKQTYWNQFDDCPRCDAAPSKPCLDMRYVDRTGRFETYAAHEGRPKHG